MYYKKKIKKAKTETKNKPPKKIAEFILGLPVLWIWYMGPLKFVLDSLCYSVREN